MGRVTSDVVRGMSATQSVRVGNVSRYDASLVELDVKMAAKN